MRLEWLYLGALYTLAAIGMAAPLVGLGSMGVLSACLLLAGAGLVRVHVYKKPLGWLVTTFCAFAAFAVVLLEYYFAGGDVLLASVHMACALQLIKLFGRQRPRDHMQVFLLSLMQVGLGAVLTIDFVFAVCFVLYAIVGTWALVLYCLVAEMQRCQPKRLKHFVLGRRTPLALASLALAMALCIVVGFVSFPRFSAVVFDIRRNKTPQRVSGFSEEVSLNDISSIKVNADRVMQISIDRRGPKWPDRPYWRGASFDHYVDGNWQRSWQSYAGQTRRLAARVVRTGARSDGSKWWRFPTRHRHLKRSELSQATVTLAPLGSELLFAVSEVVEVVFTSAAQPDAVYRTPGDNIVASGLPPADTRYEFSCYPADLVAARVAQVVPDGIVYGVDFLGLDGVDEDHLRRLAQGVVDQAQAQTAFEKAEALEAFLKRDYAYTLAPETTASESDPVAFFLFESRRGHCELFASAFVLLARTLGLPARFVSGFRSGDWNELGKFYQVRQSDAHAWCEVHFRDVGWVGFDPTGDGGIRAEAQEANLITRWVDFLRYRWLTNVVGFNRFDQLEMLNKVRDPVTQWRARGEEWAASWRKRLPRWSAGDLARGLGWLAAGILGLLVLAVSAIVLRRWLSARGAGLMSAPTTIAFYLELCEVLARHGYVREPWETAAEFHARASVLDERIATATRPYYAVRYGGHELIAAQVEELRSLIEALRERPRRQARGLRPTA